MFFEILLLLKWIEQYVILLQVLYMSALKNCEFICFLQKMLTTFQSYFLSTSVAFIVKKVVFGLVIDENII